MEKSELEDYYVYDIELYPNVFSVAFLQGSSRKIWTFEISFRKDESEKLRKFLAKIYKEKGTMVGYNNNEFDYSVIHYFLKHRGCSYKELYEYGMAVIAADQFEKFKFIIPEYKHVIRQLDLYKINHFDNAAKRTSLKMIEFNRMSPNIEDLPFPVGKELTSDEVDTLLKYNCNDIKETYGFMLECYEGIALRASLTEKYGIDFSNFNDTKIGKEFFVMRLEEENPNACYVKDKQSGRRKPRQTKRKKISLDDVILPYIEFKNDEFQQVKDWLSRQVITETKGVFTDIEEHDLGGLAKYANMETKSKKLPEKKIDKKSPEIAELIAPTKLRGKKRPEKEVLDAIWEKVIDMKRPDEDDIALLKEQRPKSWVEEKRLKSGKDNVSFNWHWRQASCLNTVFDGFQYDFGVGGIHGSLSGETVYADDEYEIIDADVECGVLSA